MENSWDPRKCSCPRVRPRSSVGMPVDAKSQGIVLIVERFEMEDMTNTVIIREKQVRCAERPSSAIGAISAHLIENLCLLSSRESLMECLRAHEISKWVLCIKFCCRAVRMLADPS